MKTYSYIFSVIKHGQSIDWDDVVLPSKVFTSIEALKLGIIQHGEELAKDYSDDYRGQDRIVNEFIEASKRLVIDWNVGYVNLYIDCMELVLIVQRCRVMEMSTREENKLISG